MDQPFLDQLEQWHQAGQFQQIIDAIEAISPEDRGYQLTGLLARAYENAAQGQEHPEYHHRALELLQTAVDLQDPDWHFRMGFALYFLDREEEAIPYFQAVFELIDQNEETLSFWADCRELLEECQQTAERCKLQEQYGDGNTLDPEQARAHLLHVALHNSFETEDVVEGDHLLLPQWDLTVTPVVEQLSQQGIVLGFHLHAPRWGRELCECCVGVGSSPQQSMGMAVGSFLFSFMQGIAQMERREDGHPMESRFAGKVHRWQAYLSNLVGMGNSPQVDGPDFYWNALKEDIVKRLGNQRLCYVKIYGAKVNGEVTGECRIDDVKSEELSAKVARLVERWDVEGFASHKQFFFIRQEEATTLPNPYLGREGQERLKSKVIQAARMFHACKSQQQYDTLEQRLAQALGDPTLAAECQYFLPEICAENAYQEQVSFAETLDILPRGEEKQPVYKVQLADFYPLWRALFDAFQEGAFGEAANDIYREYIGVSAIYSVLQKMQKDGSKLEDARLTSLLFRVDSDFEIR